MSSFETITVMVKSFLRPQLLSRFLISVAEYQAHWDMEFADILIGDDSDPDTKAEIKSAIDQIVARYPKLNITFQDLDYYVGCGLGRNLMVENIRTPHLLYCDDDYIFDPECDIAGCLDLMVSHDLDLISGWWKNLSDLDGDFRVQNFVGDFGNLHSKHIQCYIDTSANDELRLAEYHTNFYIGRTDVIKKLKWHPELKTEEHPEFFLRAAKADLKMAFTNRLYIKHHHPKGDERYEAFRSTNHAAGRRALYRRLAVADVERWDAFYQDVNTIRHWSIDLKSKTSNTYYHTLSEPERKRKADNLKALPVYNQRVQIERISPDYENHFFGYFDIQAMNHREDQHLSLRVPFMDHQPTASDVAEICVIDETQEPKVIATTRAWNFQQGAFLQYRPQHQNEIVYNDYDPEDMVYRSVVRKTNTDESRILPLPLANISEDGKKGLSVNFSRLYDYRPGYGYSNIIDPFYHDIAPEWDGIWMMDLETGSHDLLVSYEKLWNTYFKGTKWADDKVIINHLNFNPSGTRIFALLRVFSETAPFPTISIVVDVATGETKRVFGFGSHYDWKNDDELVVSGEDIVERSELTGMSLYAINVASGHVRRVDDDFFKGDGHCTFSPDRRFILYDSYCSTQVPYRSLQLYDTLQGRGVTLCRLFSDPLDYFEDNDCRCDLHPRWSPDAKYISFDSIHEGYRGIYRVAVAEAIDVLNTSLAATDTVDLNGNPIIPDKQFADHVRRTGNHHHARGKGPAAKGAAKAKSAQTARSTSGSRINLTEKQRADIARWITVPKQLPRHGRLLTLLNTLKIDRIALKLYKRLFLRTNASIALLAGLTEEDKREATRKAKRKTNR